MGVELDVRIRTPLSDEDNELLSGIAMMTISIANQQAARFIVENRRHRFRPFADAIGAVN